MLPQDPPLESSVQRVLVQLWMHQRRSLEPLDLDAIAGELGLGRSRMEEVYAVLSLRSLVRTPDPRDRYDTHPRFVVLTAKGSREGLLRVCEIGGLGQDGA